MYGENSTEVQQLETKLNQAKTTLKQFENSLQSVGRSGSQAADGMAEINKKLDMNNLMEAAEVLQGISEKLIEMGKSIVNTAIEFDGSQRKIQASLGLTGKGAENLQKIAVDTWKKGFGENLEEVDNALIKVYQNMRDVPYNELQMASEDVLTLAKVYDVDLNEATRGAGQLMSQFGLSTQETFDLLAAGAQEGLNYSDELFDNLSEYAPLFKQGGFSAQEMFTILANGTRDGAYNLDYINDTVAEFGKKVQDGSKGTADAFVGLSKETQGIWKAFNDGKATAADVFKAVIGDLGSMDDKVKQNQIGVGLFATRWEDMGAKAVLGLTDVNGGLGDVNGRMDEMKKLQEESLGQQFRKALRETQAALEPLGKKFAELAKDILPPIVDGIKSVMDWFSKLSEADQTLLIVMGLLSTAFIILTPIVAALAVSFGALNLAFLPVIATIAAVSLVITGIIMLIKNWGAITDWLSKKWSDFKEWFGDLWSGIVQACSDGWDSTVEYFSEAWSSFVEMMHEFFDPIGQFFSDLWKDIGQICSDTWNSIVEFFSESWSSFTEMMHSFFDPIGQFFSDLWSGIVGTASSCWSSLVETASELWGTLTQAWQETWNTILTVLDPIISLISTVLEAGWLLIQAGAQIAWAAISQYIIQPIQEAYNWVSGQIGELVSWLSTQWEIAKAAAQIGWGLFKQYIIQPVQETWNLVKEKFSDLVSWLSSQWELAKSYTLAGWNLIKQYVIQPVQELWNTTKEKLGDLANWILGNWEKIKSYTLAAWNLVKQYVVQPAAEAYNSAKEKFESLYNSAREKFDAVKNAAQEKFEAAKRFIMDPIRDAVDGVKGFIDKIKGFFDNLKLKIPKPEMPKMPHFSLETSTKNVLGNDITYPSGLNVQWRAKGGIFTRPTIFGMNGGNLQGAGEAGPEGVLPLNKKTLGAIGEGIAETMSKEPTVININNPVVRNDRDIKLMGEEIDSVLAQRGRNAKIGIGRN